VRIEILSALAAMEDVSALHSLIQYLSANVYQIRIAAANALNGIKTSRTAEIINLALKEALMRENVASVKSALADALK
jgi:HEAT repeat protein